jgi:D-sedoheptulose 7-phosphate isomerase
MTDHLAYITREIQDSIEAKNQLARSATTQIADAAAAILSTLRAGGKLIAFGNGGSASDAEHMVAELVGRYRTERRALSAIALTTNSSSLTAIANDSGFEQIFARQLEALARKGDAVLAISTSGNSPNVLLALETAGRLGVTRIGLTGKEGHRLRELVDICIAVPSSSTPRIQEAHALIIHILCGIVENAFVDRASDGKISKDGGAL